jgi:hypothetical protein
VLSLLLDAPIALPERARQAWASSWAPDVTPVWDGSHLLRMWHMRRDMGLWFPWWDRTLAAARAVEPRLAPEDLQQEIREAAKQPASFAPAWQAAIGWPLPERLAQLPHRVALLVSGADLFGQCLDQAAAVRPDAHVIRYADTTSDRAAAVRAALAG